MGKYYVNEVVEGVVTGIEDYGIFVSLDEYYTGLIHISEVSNKFVRDINNFVTIGETIKVKILECDDENCHVKLSIKDIDYRINKKKYAKINETGTGFKVLKDSLDAWIKEKSLD